MIRNSFIFCAVTLFASPAFSEDTLNAGADWTGFYAGGQFVVGSVDDGSTDFDTVSLGLHGGYLYDFGSWVLGAELNYSTGEIDDDGFELDVDSFRGQLIAGYDLGRYMPYLTAGLSDLDVESAGSDQSTYFGIGVVYQLETDWRIGAEYTSGSITNFRGDDFDVDIDVLNLRASYGF